MLITHGSVGRVRKHFADQFETDGDGYLYRRFSKGAAIRVSAQERDGFVAAFDRTLRRAIWISLGGGIGLGVVLAVVAGVAGLAWRFWRVYTAPSHDLRHRLPVARERSGADMQRLALARLGYRQLGLGVAGAVVVLAIKIPQWRTTSGQLWIAFAVATLAVFVVQGLRKRRFAREAARWRAS